MENFTTYMPRTSGSMRHQAPHIRVETQPNGRTRFYFYAAVRDWLELKYDRNNDTFVEMLTDHAGGKILVKGIGMFQDGKPSAIPVRGLSNNGYLTLPGFTYDFPIFDGKYRVELLEHEGSRAVLLDTNTLEK